MSPTVVDFPELLKALEGHPEWREELRRLLFPEVFVRFPELMAEVTATLRDASALTRELVQGQQRILQELGELRRRTDERFAELTEAQRRTEEKVAELSEAQRRTDEAVRRLAEAQERTEARLSQLAAAQERTEAELAELRRRTDERFAELTEAQRRTEEKVAELSEAQRRTEIKVAELAEAQARTEKQLAELAQAHYRLERRVVKLEDRVGWLMGEAVERRYRERAAAYFGRWLRRLEVVDGVALARLLDEALAAGQVSEDERAEVLSADVVVRGQDRHGKPMVLVVEASSRILEEDVRRAVERAAILGRAFSLPAVPVVAGQKVDKKTAALCQEQGVWWLLDRRLSRIESAP